MSNFVQRVFLHNIGLKLISLAIAVAVWFSVVYGPVADVEVRIPIEFRNLPENLEIDSATFTEAHIRVRGPERLVHQLQSTDARAEIDLRNVTPGERTFDLTSHEIHVPPDLEVVQVIPGQFHLTFDNRATRVVAVRPRVTGNFATGMRVTQTIAEPASVMITGPRRRVEAVEAATTDPVDVSGSMTHASFMTQAYIPDPLIQVVHPTPIRVTVIMEGSGNEKK